MASGRGAHFLRRQRAGGARAVVERRATAPRLSSSSGKKRLGSISSLCLARSPIKMSGVARFICSMDAEPRRGRKERALAGGGARERLARARGFASRFAPDIKVRARIQGLDLAHGSTEQKEKRSCATTTKRLSSVGGSTRIRWRQNQSGGRAS